MSRALDKSVKEALKHGDHHQVFLDISGVLTESSGQLLEIELLGKSHVLDPDSTVLRDENAVAIPKLRIVQAFIVAQKLHKKFLSGNQDVSMDQVLRSTAVMLLMDPEHLTAANTRKRLITNELKDGSVEGVLRTEKHLLDSLLTSRLHRHTKSPTLWNHRRWLMEQYRLYRNEVSVENDITRIIMVSGERHPRNYYAWCHARYLTSAFILPSSKAKDALSEIIRSTEKWCFSHHNDISGWQFLIFLLDKHPSETSLVFRETLKLASSFKWRNESVWYFLRYIAAWGATATDMTGFENTRRVLLENAAEDETGKRTLERAQQWLEVVGGF
ncbi:protein ecm9 [Fusarium sporotrichioides]|uniref:Protein ecm9 n=1 Tax=Fusarium sporotrichioides TaxID=5514 RepID=A0A395RME5_FUSSP|nr:protein ecm9 [Fusarium sporotrichioides]